jgi:hypothetical protein
MERDGLLKRTALACGWLTGIAQVKEATPPSNTTTHHAHNDWRGAIRGEYLTAGRKWWSFCPVWHTGQALKALCLAHPFLKEPQILDAARLLTATQSTDPLVTSPLRRT